MYAELLHLSVQEMLAMAEVLQNDRKGFRNTIAAMARTERFNMTQLFLMSLALDTTNEWMDAFAWAVGCRKVCYILKYSLTKKNIDASNDEFVICTHNNEYILKDGWGVDSGAFFLFKTKYLCFFLLIAWLNII